ncbi:hypothetical protein [Halopenitus persicus]|uniref:Uncharacterized protein n=1 Tax=Halopenitus persicus TaxID=1048396 RepID=A0A1H3M3G8_9EURY|nr:hypothetical protein [Halopenitus persicus]SDY71282.1 hypothetical protein SAMN05216564_108126 [Halopenitus persicus]
MQLQSDIHSEDAKKHCETPGRGDTAQINGNLEYLIARINRVQRANTAKISGDARDLVGEEVVRDA